MTESRQVRRARERHEAKAAWEGYPRDAQKGGPSKMRIHRNRRHRWDELDYFPA